MHIGFKTQKNIKYVSDLLPTEMILFWLVILCYFSLVHSLAIRKFKIIFLLALTKDLTLHYLADNR